MAVPFVRRGKSPVSLAVETEAHCPHCTSCNRRTEWVAIDLFERPDLKPVLASGDWITRPCAKCSTPIPRSEALLVTRLSVLAPVLLALCYEDLESEKDVVEKYSGLIEGVRQRLGADVADVPGPLLLVPYEVLMIAVGRDIAEDVGDNEVTLASLRATAPVLALNYQTFLAAVAGSNPERRLVYALDHLLSIRSREELQRLVTDYPELCSEDARARLAQWVAAASDDEERHVAESQLMLLKHATSGDFDTAWSTYEQAVLEMSINYLTPRIKRLFESLDELIEESQWTNALPLAEELLELAGPMGGEHIEAPAALRAASVLLEMRGEGRGERLERAIALLRRTIEIYETRPELGDRLARAQALQNLGAAIAERHYGDPLANQERAIALQREALRLLTIRDGHTWALGQTNLGLGLLERARARRTPPSEWQDEEATQDAKSKADVEIEEAIECFAAALQWRAFDRDPRDWAYTQINLALAYSRRVRGDPQENLRRALAHDEDARRGFAAAGDPILGAQVLHNISDHKLRLAQLDSTSRRESESLLVEAAEAARASLMARSLDDAPVHAGLAWRQLGDCLVALDDLDGAANAYRTALHGLTPESAPREARDAARRLAGIWSQRGDWRHSAEAWETAAEAAARSWETRATASGRSVEFQENLNVFRWAAYALAKIGRPERAIELLELGRARQLTMWISSDLLDIERLRLLDPSLEQRYRAIQEEIATLDRDHRIGAELDITHAAAVMEARQEVLLGIRALPGFASFLERPRFDGIAAALAPHDALAYLLTSPDGSLALVVENGTAKVIEAPDLTSTDLFRAFLEIDLQNEKLSGYLITHRNAPDEVGEALQAFSATLGAQLLAPLAGALEDSDATTLVLVPISLLGILPLHALSWEEEQEPRCLLDLIDVVFTPSALFRSVCLARATEYSNTSTRGLVVGGPEPQSDPLPGAALEAELVAKALSVDRADVLVGSEATKDKVLAMLPGSTHVHFACHGAASFFSDTEMEAALYFAHDEPLSAAEILDISSFRPRLVTASACETGVIQRVLRGRRSLHARDDVRCCGRRWCGVDSMVN